MAYFTGTFKGPMKGLDGQMIQPTNKKFQTEFCTVEIWKDHEERLFYNLVGVMIQIGAMPSSKPGEQKRDINIA